MGLDMYFYGTKNFSVFPRDAVRQPLEKTFEFTSLINNHGMENAPIDYDTAWASYDIKFPLMYWRKSNQIHKWFVDNVQEGNDNCQRHYVSKEKLVELFETINTILNCSDPLNREQVAKELLPTDIEGCFFGSEEYDDYYFEELEDTKKVLDKVFAYEKTAEAGHCFDGFYYQSSW